MKLAATVLLGMLLCSCDGGMASYQVFLGQGVMVGEVGETSAILQARLTKTAELVDGVLAGADGVGYFELAPYNPVTGMVNPRKTKLLKAVAENDHIIKAKVPGLGAGCMYEVRLLYGRDEESLRHSPRVLFRTLHGKSVSRPLSFAVVTGMNYNKFHLSKKISDQVKKVGFPALVALDSEHPDFFVATGDNVYYDHPKKPAAETVEQMRKKYHEQFGVKRFSEFFASVPTYWEKDDHDFRYNDCDNTGDRKPTVADGLKIFREQLPVVDPADDNAVMYRTHRVNKDLQIWLVEGRDYRSPNDMADGQEKTIWGAVQKKWLKDTLLASDAEFKILISPTPMVGPDDAYKKDNHVNQKGFRHEGDEFFAWLTSNGFLEKNFYIVCGDRHWQYHSVHPDGFEEFSCGAMVDANSRVGRLPGDKKSTDPNAEIKQPYCMTKASGGYLMVHLTPAEKGELARLTFMFKDETGRVLYKNTKLAGK